MWSRYIISNIWHATSHNNCDHPTSYQISDNATSHNNKCCDHAISYKISDNATSHNNCDYSHNIYKYNSTCRDLITNQRLPGACNRSPGSKLLSITTQLHCGGHLGGRAQLPDTILEEDHPMTIPSKFGFNWATGSRQDGFYVNFP